MFRIYPVPEFEAKCPLDDEILIVEEIVIPGMRCLADTVCPVCGNKYFVDLPVGQALWSPIILNQNTNEIYDDYKITWFSNLLLEDYQSQASQDIIPVVHKFHDSERIIILNCLDFLYGHSLLKLLNVQRYMDKYPELGCCVLVPTQLMHLVPKGVAEIWEVPVKIKDGRKWYPSLNNWLQMQIKSRKECFLSKGYSHPGNEYYDLNKFVYDLPDVTRELKDYSPILMFSYRENRNWGKSIQDQQKNIQKLYDKLSDVFPDMAFVLVGFGHKNHISEGKSRIIDLRAKSFNVDTDKLWMAYMKKSDCVIGVHGSNMLLPSGLAKTTLELVPSDRIGNTIQSFLFPPDIHDIRDGLLRYRLLYGDESLSNIFPSQVLELIVYLLSFEYINEEWFKVGVENDAVRELVKHQKSSVFRQAVTRSKASMQSTLEIRLKKMAKRILWRLDGSNI